MQLIRKNIYNAWPIIIAKFPSNFTEVHDLLHNDVIVTAEKENFVLENNSEKKILFYFQLKKILNSSAH